MNNEHKHKYHKVKDTSSRGSTYKAKIWNRGMKTSLSKISCLSGAKATSSDI
jgi:hypothetical protein